MSKCGLTCAELIIYNVNFAEIRDLMLAGSWDKIGEILAEIARKLEVAGADYVVIATNTMHKLADFIQSQIDIPLIHIADCVAKKCKEKGILNVGLLGTKYTMCENFLVDRLEQNGLSEQTDIDEIDRIIFDELCKEETKNSSKDRYKKVIDRMIKEDGIEGIVLGCTEIEMLIKPEDLNVPIFDTTQSHIDTIVDIALERSSYEK